MVTDRTGCPSLDVATTAKRSCGRRRVVAALAGLTLALGGVPATAEAAGALNGRVGFTTFRFNGTGDIASMNPDGSDLQRLTMDPPARPLYDAQSDWSPDIPPSSEDVGLRRLTLRRRTGWTSTLTTRSDSCSASPSAGNRAWRRRPPTVGGIAGGQPMPRRGRAARASRTAPRARAVHRDGCLQATRRRS